MTDDDVDDAQVGAWARYLGRRGALAVNARRTPEERRRIASLGGKAAAEAMSGDELAARATKGAAAATAKRAREEGLLNEGRVTAAKSEESTETSCPPPSRDTVRGHQERREERFSASPTGFRSRLAVYRWRKR